MTSASKVRSLASFVKSGSTDLPGPEIWASLVRDYEHIAANIDSCGRRLEAMTLIITSFIMIAESRRSFLETMNVSRLTYLALIFVLLTFVSSLFQHGRRYRARRKRLLGLLRSGNSCFGFGVLDSPSSQ
jgi:hypothetical protein